MQKHWPIPPFTYLRHPIPLYFNDQSATDLACLDNDTCIVKFKSGAQLIPLNSSSTNQSKTFDFTPHKIYFCKILPCKGGNFCLFDGINFMFINKEFEVNERQYGSSFVYFGASGQVWKTDKKVWGLVGEGNVVGQGGGTEGNKWVRTADSEESIIGKVVNDLVTVINIKTGKITQLNIPQQIYQSQKHNRKFNFYLLNQKQGLYGYKHSQKYQFIICLINFQQNKLQQLKSFQGQGDFVSINKDLGQIILKIEVSQVKNLIVVYNYRQRTLVWQHKQSEFKYSLPSTSLWIEDNIEIAKKWSPDMKNYVELERINCKTTLVHYKRVESKKIYFHLMLKSGKMREYREGIARRVLSVLMG